MTELTPPSSQHNTPSRHRSPRGRYQDEMEVDAPLSESSSTAGDDPMSMSPSAGHGAVYDSDGEDLKPVAGEVMDSEPTQPSPTPQSSRLPHDTEPHRSVKASKTKGPAASKNGSRNTKGDDQLLDSALVAKWRRVIGDVCDDSAVGKLTAGVESIKSAT